MKVECERCYRFEYVARAELELRELCNDFHDLRSWLRSESARQRGPYRFYPSGATVPADEPLSLTVEQALSISNMPSIPERLNRALTNISRLGRRAGEVVQFKVPEDWPLLYARSEEEAHYTLTALHAMEYLTDPPAGSIPRAVISPKGWERVEDLESVAGSKQVFVAMALGEPDPGKPDTKAAFKHGIAPAILRPKLGHRSRFEPFPVWEKPHSNKICEEILLEIRRSRAVVADLTYQRPNVYFEAGYAKGRGIPVIWLCHEDHFDSKKNDEGYYAHFDVRQHQCIQWREPEDILEQLPNYLEAILTP